MHPTLISTIRVFLLLTVVAGSDVARAQCMGIGGVSWEPRWLFEAHQVATEPFTVASQRERAAEKRMLAILNKPFDGKRGESTLDDFLDELKQSARLPIELETHALDDLPIDRDAPINADVPAGSIRSTLKLVLKPLGLTWSIREERLLVINAQTVNEFMALKVYPIADLIGPNPRDERIDRVAALIETLQQTIAPTTWDEAGGKGLIKYYAPAGAIAVSQTLENHDDIQRLLATLRKVRDLQHIDLSVVRRNRERVAQRRHDSTQGAGSESLEPLTVATEAEREIERRILSALTSSLGKPIEPITLSQLVVNLAREADIAVVLDREALRGASVDPDSWVCCDLPKVSLRAALEAMLTPLDLTWTIQDGRLVVTTPAIAEGDEILVVYPVSDLVEVGESELIQIIADVVEPTSQPLAKGRGKTEFVPSVEAIVIGRRRSVHEQIGPFLEALRDARDAQGIERVANERWQPPNNPPAPAGGGMF